MENNQKKYIKQNLVKLVGCTKNEPTLLLQLLTEGFISHNTWAKIKGENPDSESRMTWLYYECLKTPKYDALVQCLEESENETAADILRNIPDQNESHSRTTSTSSRSISESASAPATATNFEDFVVEDKHIKLISKIINENMTPEGWEEVKSIWLSQKMRNDIGKQPSVKLDIMTSLRTWISGTAKTQRLFSKILDAFEDYPTVTEKLIDAFSGTS